MPSTEPIIVRSIATDDDLAAAPINPAWIIEGTPRTRSRALAFTTPAGLSATIWETTAGRFDWHYGPDEMIEILDGEVELTSASGRTTTLRRGDLAFFPGNQVVRWNVAHYVKKIAINGIQVSQTRRLLQRIPLARRVVHLVRGLRGTV